MKKTEAVLILARICKGEPVMGDDAPGEAYIWGGVRESDFKQAVEVLFGKDKK